MKLPICNPGAPDYEATLRAIGMTDRAIKSILFTWPDPVSLMNATDIELRARELTPAQIRRLRGALDLGRLLIHHPPGLDMREPRTVAEFLSPMMAFTEQEIFVVLALNARFNLIQASTVAVGQIDTVMVYPTIVFRDAIRAVATGVILAHNHPSGDPEPSDSDVAITQRFLRAGRLLGIPVWDHIIIGRPGRFCSMTREGYIVHPQYWE